jgi:hypothetical protein
MRYEIPFPQIQTDYWDYKLEPVPDDSGEYRIIVMFEHPDGMVTHKSAGYTKKQPSEWRTFQIEEQGEGDQKKLIMEI